MRTPKRTKVRNRFVFVHLFVGGTLFMVFAPYADAAMIAASDIMLYLPFVGGLFSGIFFTICLLSLLDALGGQFPSVARK